MNKLADMINRPNAKWIAPRGTALESFIKVNKSKVHCVTDSHCAFSSNLFHGQIV